MRRWQARWLLCIWLLWLFQGVVRNCPDFHPPFYRLPRISRIYPLRYVREQDRKLRLESKAGVAQLLPVPGTSTASTTTYTPAAAAAAGGVRAQ